VVTTPSGLFKRKYTVFWAVGANDPSTQMTWRRIDPVAEFGDATVDCHPSFADEDPQDRRDPNPARARVFCRRSPSSNYETSELSSTSKPISSTSRLAVSIGGMNSSIGGQVFECGQTHPVEEEFGVP